ncbi:MAG: hypothetical protein RLY31_28 [Bacteroidota bacterium]|jgi:hypothetical protein
MVEESCIRINAKDGCVFEWYGNIPTAGRTGPHINPGRDGLIVPVGRKISAVT